MGYMRHHAIVVTSFNAMEVKAAQNEAHRLGMSPSSIQASLVNSEKSFFVPPDGSKEGWADSDKGDERRATFTKWLQEHSYCEWVEVSFGHEGGTAAVEACSGGEGE